MNKLMSLALLSWLAGAALVGCSKSPEAIGTSYSKAFESADASTKTAWDLALAAVKTNGYATAILTLNQVRQQPNLTPEQVKAVVATSAAVSDQMYAAVNKGDANAIEAVKQLRNNFRR